MTTLIAVHQRHRVNSGRALFIRPQEKINELVDFMLPGSTLHKLDETTDAAALLAQVDQQLQSGEFKIV